VGVGCGDRGAFTDSAVQVDGHYVTPKRSTTPEEPMNGVLETVALPLGRTDLTPAYKREDQR
jgi:hypothetical protein